MAISLTLINGTDSISASRITINDNFSTLSSALNSVLSIINISNGNITTTGSINTANLTVTGTLTAQTFAPTNIAATTNITLGGYLEFGSASGVQIKKLSKNTGAFTALDLSGTTGTTGATYAGVISYIGLPKATTVNIKSIQNPELGAFVYDITQNVLAYCKGTTSTAGGTGTWFKIGTTGAIAL